MWGTLQTQESHNRRRGTRAIYNCPIFSDTSIPFVDDTGFHRIPPDEKKQKAPVSRGLLVFLGLSRIISWSTRSQRIRTEGEVPFEVALTELSKASVYQEIAEKAAHLHLLGMNPNRIAVHLGVDRTTVTRALRWIRSH